MAPNCFLNPNLSPKFQSHLSNCPSISRCLIGISNSFCPQLISEYPPKSASSVTFPHPSWCNYPSSQRGANPTHHTLDWATITSCLDHSSGLLSLCCGPYAPHPVLKAAARVVFSNHKSAHIPPLPKTLQWPLISIRVRARVLKMAPLPHEGPL